ncbi:DUF6029 family protein [Tenuifilum thalassicum]|uniref:TonB-dependent receptor n=1 Tax=Tenuifilum thalassicum TaxID=2590900 RepID=A0A7D4BE95_9BACT|nr:DUF6029 family protein [Tenuifilum thalassicum]QKG79838.1 hypothetical protein FHG85_06045 [Tenuifilum thalassicum]
MILKRLALIVFIGSLAFKLDAQIFDKGTFSGSFETNNNLYRTDSVINANAPDDKFGSNTYFKFDYKLGKFSAGIQYEAYMPPLVGYSQFLKGNKIIGRYASYEDSLLTFTVGTFYEQFGNGLILRSYEERALGINNSIDGFSVKLHPIKSATIKAIWGKQRKYLDYGEGTLRGIDAELNLSTLLWKEPSVNIIFGGSWVSKYQEYTGTNNQIPTTVDAYAARLMLEYGSYSLNAEYMTKDKDPMQLNLFSMDKGNALLLQQSIVGRGLGATLSLRRVENADFRSERQAIEASFINYVPALTKQHKYALANLHPYSTQMMGEIGGQLDIFYSVPRKTNITWAKGVKINLNVSSYWKPKGNEYLSISDTLFFRDVGIEIEKKFSYKFKTALSFINQYYNKGAITGGASEVITNIAVLESYLKLRKNIWLKLELSELFPVQNENNWSLALAEVSFAPKWTIFASDMIDHAEQNIHYYNFGFSYTKNASRIGISWGRNREGLQCIGGLCRFVPAYSGFTFSISTVF